MADSNINPVAFSSAIVAGAIGATVASKTKPYVNKVVNITSPVVDTVSISAKKVAEGAGDIVNEFSEGEKKILASIGKSILKGFKAIKTFISDFVKQIKFPEPSHKIVNNTSGMLKSYAIVAGISAGLLYAGYKMITSQKEDK